MLCLENCLFIWKTNTFCFYSHVKPLATLVFLVTGLEHWFSMYNWIINVYVFFVSFSLLVCNIIVHDKCLKTVALPCVSIAATLVKNPVAHVWSERIVIKRKFCNVCRKKIEDVLGLCCEGMYANTKWIIKKRLKGYSNIIYIMAVMGVHNICRTTV